MFSKIIKIFLIFLVLIVFANVLVINWYLFLKEKPAEKDQLNEIDKKINTVSIPQNKCSSECISLIKEATASISQAGPEIIKETKYETINTGSREVIIPFGVGSTSSVSWADLTGIEAYIDSSKYAGYKEAYFEATLRIPSGTGKAFVQLYNVTAKHPVWFSELSLEGGTPQMLVSPKIRLDEESNLYRVQLKSSMSVLVYLDSARVRIIF